MNLGDLTKSKLLEWEDFANNAIEIINKWKSQILSIDRPYLKKKEDLRQINALEKEIDAAESALHSLFWEIQQLQNLRAQDLKRYDKLKRYCRALGGDPSLIYYHSDKDFV